MALIKSVPIGKVLQEYGFITEEQIQEALVYQRENRDKRLGEVLLEQGYVTEEEILTALSSKFSVPRINIDDINVDAEAVKLIPRQLAEKYNVLGIRKSERELTVVVNDPLNYYGLEDVRQTIGMELDLELCELEPLKKAIQYYYSELNAVKAANKANATLTETIGFDAVEAGNIEDEEAPIINLLNSLIQRAYTNYASDIHIEPFEKETLVRMRVDGVIIDYMTLQKAVQNSLIARIKILGNLDIAERRVPQDGHFRIQIEGDYINIRVSVIPTVFGEKAVLRLLTSNARIDHAGHYGMDENSYNRFSKILKNPNGILYITGPTGSGKSTTLYMVLEEMTKRQLNISTIEDPVEKNVARVNQMQVNNVAGLTFEVGLRALLRQDPDVIMVGETRDSETAGISIRAAITGHFVLSTLHTNNAAASIVRLVDMGMEPFMIASSVVGIVAQRLMRKLCTFCKQEVEATADDIAMAGKPLKKIYKPCGCPQCSGTGYKGRIAIHEILEIDFELKKMISAGASVEQMQEYGIEKQGMKTLKTQGLALVEEGLTSMEELIKVAYTA